MKTLYESILDNDEILINQSDKTFGDMCNVECLELFDESYDDADPTTFFNTMDIYKYCKRNKLEIERYWSVDAEHTNVTSSLDDMDWLRTVIMSVPYIGFEQNIEKLLQEFLKPKFKIRLQDSRSKKQGADIYDGSIFYEIASSKKSGDIMLLRVWYNKNH